MLVSIIIPTYNRSALLGEAIRSAIDQTFRPIECIVVDDGSTDNTKEVVEKLAEQTDNDFNLKYIFQHNAGSQAARNTGTIEATGEFIQYLDSDDILYPDKLNEQVNYLLLYKECDGVFGDWQVGNPEQNEAIIAHKGDDFIAQILTDRCIANFSFLMRRSIIEKTGPWDVAIKRNQEIDYHLRAILVGGNFHYMSLTCGLWRTHGGERIANKASLFHAIQFYRKWEQLLLEKGLLNDKIKAGIAANYMWFLGEYAGSSYKELVAILKELQRLHPVNPIFLSSKFRFFKKLSGFNTAARIWVYRYKQGVFKKA